MNDVVEGGREREDEDEDIYDISVITSKCSNKSSLLSLVVLEYILT